MIDFNVDSNRDREILGLKDRGIISVCCNKCKNNLVDFQVTKNNIDLVEENINPISTNALIICDMCKTNNSINIKGQFYIGAGQENISLETKDSDRDYDLIILARLK